MTGSPCPVDKAEVFVLQDGRLARLKAIPANLQQVLAPFAPLARKGFLVSKDQSGAWSAQPLPLPFPEDLLEFEARASAQLWLAAVRAATHLNRLLRENPPPEGVPPLSPEAVERLATEIFRSLESRRT